MASKPLTSKMEETVKRIRANGGRVGYGLNAYKALGINGHAVNGLRKRGILTVETDQDKRTWLVLIPSERTHLFRATYGQDLNAGTDKPQNWVWHCGDCNKTREDGPHFLTR